jgi:hypothetical protein
VFQQFVKKEINNKSQDEYGGTEAVDARLQAVAERSTRWCVWFAPG